MIDPKTRELLREELKKVAPGTHLREGLDMILAARTGALIVIGDEAGVKGLCDGGFIIDTPFTPQRVFELAKMDGAIILDQYAARIMRANAHLQPDPSLPTSETGMRHRTAERVSRQTKALVISVSQRRQIVSLYLRGRRITLEDTEVVLAKANQALQTLQNYRTRLGEVMERVTHLEFDDLVTLGDVAEAIGRFEMVRRVSHEVARYIGQLGTEGRLVRMQADELTAGIDDQYNLLVRDYAADPASRNCAAVRTRLGDLPLDRLLEPDAVAHELGLDAGDRGEQHLRPRGYRVLAQIPALPSTVVNRIVERFCSLPAMVRATAAELDDVDGVGTRRAKAIASGLSRIRAHAAV
ncbi:MAG: DNA integrity scanning protein DisA [Coriobacteriia bacterium]|nr:DNA integrity scanning protein DisA [Coriobacteriia bacterium]